MTFDIDWSKLIAVIAALVGFIVGWVIAFLDSNGRASKKIGAAEAKAEAAIRQAKSEAERAAAQAALVAAQPAPPALPGTTLLRLWLDSAERPALDLDGQNVDTTRISELHRKRLVTLLSMMRPWIDSKLAAPVGTAQTNVPAPAPRPAPPPVAPAPSNPAQGKPVPPTPSAPTAKKDEKPAAPLSIVAQIDEILQARLASTTFAGRAIRLQESPEGGVIVWVGLQKFAGVGEVADPEVQSIIRAAIEEWEKKYTPGM